MIIDQSLPLIGTMQGQGINHCFTLSSSDSLVPVVRTQGPVPIFRQEYMPVLRIKCYARTSTSQETLFTQAQQPSRQIGMSAVHNPVLKHYRDTKPTYSHSLTTYLFFMKLMHDLKDEFEDNQTPASRISNLITILTFFLPSQSIHNGKLI